MTSREKTKMIARYIVGYGSGVIVYAIIKNNVAPTRIDRKIAAAVASVAIVSCVAVRAERRSDILIDEFFDQFDKLKKDLQK